MAVVRVNDQTFKEAVGQNGQVIIKFFADWCGSCKLISPKYKRLSEDERFSNVMFLEINAEENPEARRWAGVTNLPYFAALKGGQVVEADSFGKEEKIIDLLMKIQS
ncbi:MAG: thioredoxin family protein [Bacteroidota bacterium]|nr:thioredoxin family protein [Bacteroidota bacterium]